jgi:DNA mismatch repair protein MutS
MGHNAEVKLTPMLRQYLDLKEQAGDALLLYRMGDFYELFFEDAQRAAPVLGITLTRRRHNDEVDAPMCGVPHHAFDGYLGRLLRSGFRVAVAEQVEDPATAKGLVRREIVRTHTPGTTTDEDHLEDTERCYLAAFGADHDHAAVAWIEVSSGTFEGLESTDPRTVGEQLASLRPREILIPEDTEDWRSLWPTDLRPPTVTPISPESFSPSAGEDRLRRVLGVGSVRGFGLRTGERLLGLAGALLGYVEHTQKGALTHLRRFVRRHPADGLVVDRASLRNLEIERSAEGQRQGSLLAVLDHCHTRMGSRRLRDWVVRPSTDLDIIANRHRAVAELVEDARLFDELRSALAPIPDLERLAGRIGLQQATPRELVALRVGLEALPGVAEVLQHASSPLIGRLAAELDIMDDTLAILTERVAEEPAAVPGLGVIASGWDAPLDEHRSLARGGRELLADIERTERKRTGIGSLKVKYNKVFGYYIEVSKANLDRVPEHYERRQTLTNAERFATPELKELESRILTAEERATARERELWNALVETLSGWAQRLATTAGCIASLDVLGAFAHRARVRDYCRPVIDEGDDLEIRDGRHPVLEELQRDPPFVPNDCLLDSDEKRVILLTGPNMGGKSTYLRQVALITLMAHAGSFVPARQARMGLVDRVFTRVGASDALAKGESTFMVEMTETANILHHASPRSLVILDEVGRGTATYDGLSLAWSIVEYLHDRPEHAAKVLFATHYHELTDLARTLPRLVNRSMAVKEWQGSILFLHRVADGPADRSYGIHVAELAGVPAEVCRRAEAILGGLEEHTVTPGMSPPGPSGTAGKPPERLRQMDLFRSAENEIVERLQRLDLNTTTPIDALRLLADLRGILDEHS